MERIRSAGRGLRLRPDRKAERPIAHLDSFRGILQADGYAGYRRLAERGDVQLVLLGHVRRNFYNLATPGPAPIASEALQRIAALYAIENDIGGRSASDRAAAEEPTADRRIGAMAARKTRAGQPEGQAR